MDRFRCIYYAALCAAHPQVSCCRLHQDATSHMLWATVPTLPRASAMKMCCISGPPQSDIVLTRSSGRVHRVPRLVCPWHILGELGRSQFRVLSVALAVDYAEQRRLRGEMLALEGGAEDRCRDLNTCGGHGRRVC